MDKISEAKAIWGNTVTPDSYLRFRKVFSYRNDQTEAILEIAVESTFEIRLNGSVIPIQQLADMPSDRTFSRYNVTRLLRSGENELVITVRYVGDDFLTRRASFPFLQMIICTEKQCPVKTDESWEYTADTPEQSSRQCKMTSQCDYVFHVDARRKTEQYQPVKIVNQTIPLRHRQVPQLLELPRPARIPLLNYGTLIRLKTDGTAAECCAADYFSAKNRYRLFDEESVPRIQPFSMDKLFLDKKFPVTFRDLHGFPEANGYYVTIDLERETVGFLTFHLDAPAGTVVDIAYGEHLADGRVRASIDGRNFADRYICEEGENCFTWRHRRLAARYLELHIIPPSGNSNKIKLYDAGLIPLELPLPDAACFQCEDRLLMRLRDISIDTMKLCMHEHYEDCPWREQALYAYDSRNQILYGYYVWGNYSFAANSLDLLGKSFDGERYLELTSPGKLHITIPIFTLVWISELYEYWLFSGDDSLWIKWQDTVDHILDRALQDPVPGAENFYQTGDPQRAWNFYEWNGKLGNLPEHPQSLYNLYLYEALVTAAKMHRHTGKSDLAEKLQSAADRLGIALEKTFWDDKRGGYALTLHDPAEEPLFEHVQALFLANKLVPKDKKDRLAAGFKNRTFCPLSFSALPYMAKALLELGETGRTMLRERLCDIYLPLLDTGATSLWETAEGGDAFDEAGSLCHAWSSITPYYTGSLLLGVTPLKPGFTEFTVIPDTTDCSGASGEVPTPYGMIKVSWKKDAQGKIELHVENPPGTVYIQ